MLSDVLKSTYLQYKADTDAVASWLATTAKICGYAVDLLVNKDEQKPKQQSSGRLKGKARKLAREAAKDADAIGATPTERGPTYTITIKDFVSLAEWIAAFEKPPVRVPVGFARTIDRAISVRKDHGDQLSGKDEASDHRHNFFVGILEHVRDVLRPRMPAEYPRSDEANSAPSTKSSNRFEYLEVEEPSDEVFEVQGAAPASKQVAQPTYRAERESFSEAYLAFNLILEDLTRFRALISRSWQGYRQGMFDLVSVSVTTNTALGLARLLEEDAKILFEKHEGSEVMLQRYYLAACMACNEEESAKEQTDDEMNFRMYEVSSAFFLPTYLILEAFLRVIQPGSMPIMKPGFFGTYDPASDRSNKSAQEKFREDKAMLCGILPDFYIATYGPQHNILDDELTRGLRTAFETKKLPLWLVFAAQIYVDIHHILREDVSRGFEELQVLGKLFSMSIHANIKFHEALRVENWPRSNDTIVEQLLRQLGTTVGHDAVLQKKKSLRLSDDLCGEPFALLRSHPLQCGLYAYYFKIKYQDLGITFSNAWGSILYTFHLYNAVRQEKLLHSEWFDMDVIMSMQDDIFAGNRPVDFEAYLKRFYLSMGGSAVMFAKDRRKGKLPLSSSGPKGMLRELAPVALMFKDRYCEDPGRADLSEQDLQTIVSKSVWQEDEESRATSEMGLLSLSRTSKKGRGVQTGAAKTRRPPRAVELLESLRNTLQAEKLELDFDYLLMHRNCWKLLRAIQQDLDPKLREMYGPGYLEKENQLTFVVGYIFMAATETKRLGAMIAKKSDVVTSKLLAQAASVMDAYIEKHGKVVSLVMKNVLGVEIEFEEDSEDEAVVETG